MLPGALTVMRQFPFSAQQPGIQYLELHPVSWNEATTLEQRFRPGISPEEAILLASNQLHADYAYVFEAAWDLWIATEDGTQWELQASPVKFLVRGLEFEEGAYEQEGHIQVDFGMDSLFLQEDVQLTGEAQARVRSNVQMLVGFTNKLETNSEANARLLWSESEESLAQKLIARLQRVQ